MKALDTALDLIASPSPNGTARAVAALREALAARADLPLAVVSYAEAACRHLAYGEVLEARMLLTAARKAAAGPPRLVRVPSQTLSGEALGKTGAASS